MSLDDRLRSGARRLAEGIEVDPEGALDGVLRRGRARRRLRLAGIGVAGFLALGGIVGTALAVFPLADLRPGGPEPGPSPSGVQASPGYLSRHTYGCSEVRFVGDRTERVLLGCGIQPSVRRVAGGSAHQLRTPAGESLWLIVPDSVRGGVGLARPSVLITRGSSQMWVAEFAGGSDEGVALYACRAVEQPCLGVVPAVREDLPDGGRFTEWRLSNGQWLFTSVERGAWTMTVGGLRAGADLPARAITWTDHPDGYLTAESTDPEVSVASDWASVNLWLRASGGIHTMRILPGCRLSEKEPDLGGGDYGAGLSWNAGKGDTSGQARWCAGGRYLIDVDGVSESEAERLHGLLRVVPSLG